MRNPILFILKESNAASLTGTGKMDFTGNGLNNIDASGRSLYVTATRKDGYIAHNGYNFGNFLWGAGARMLGIPGIIARLGAHINNFFNDLKTKWHFDSKDDQLSIQQGINWANEHAKE